MAQLVAMLTWNWNPKVSGSNPELGKALPLELEFFWRLWDTGSRKKDCAFILQALETNSNWKEYPVDNWNTLADNVHTFHNFV
jgi:hypothetical protein